MGQEHRPSLTDSGCVSTKHVQRVSNYHFTFIAERGKPSRWRATINTWRSRSQHSTATMRMAFWNGLPSSASTCRSTASQSSKAYKGRSGHQTSTAIRRPLARVGIMPIITCSASSTSQHLAWGSLSCGGLKEKHERTE